MAWYDEAVFYHIYPLGLLGAPRVNPGGEPEHRLRQLVPWLDHLADLNVSALYIGPLFQSMTHGYDTVDYRQVDSRLGTNDDLRDLVAAAHERGIRVVLDGVFNHVGRDFPAFRDLLSRREGSDCRDWFCNVDFGGNNGYGDGLRYDNWGGHDALVKLNQQNPRVREHLLEAVRFWVDEFDIDGIRLDAADVLDFDYMHALRAQANHLKPDFWLMGEVIHGDYSRWVNGETLHAVTDYSLHKGLYSGHNDHNYFEIAHTVKRNLDLGGGSVEGLRLYNFVDNHDVSRIASKLDDPGHLAPVHVLLYTLPGVPSIYYGSEYGIEGARTPHDDAMLRPALDLEELEARQEPLEALVRALGAVRRERPELSYGEYRELALTNRQFAFARTLGSSSVIVAVNNDPGPATVVVDACGIDRFAGALSGREFVAQDGRVTVELAGDSGEVLVPAEGQGREAAAAEALQALAQAAEKREAERRAQEAAEAEQLQAVNEALRAAADQVRREETQAWPEGTEARACQQGADAEACQQGADAEASQQDAQADASSGDAGAEPPAQAANDEQLLAINEALRAAADQVRREEGQDQGSGAPKLLLPVGKPYSEWTVQELQLGILAKLAANGPVTQQMRRDVAENVYHDSLVNWIQSFR